MQEQVSLSAKSLIAPDDDRRAFRRYSLQMLAFVCLPEVPTATLGDSSHSYCEAQYTLQAVSVKDVSMTGLFFISRISYPFGTELSVRLCLDSKEYETRAIVQRRTRIDNALCGYGLRFLQSRVDKTLRMALAAFLLRRAIEMSEAAA